MQLLRSHAVIGFAIASMFLSGCASLTGQKTSAISQIVIAEPERAEFRYEIELARLDQILTEDLSKEQRAELYYRRGALYDAVGLSTLARMDFTRALEYNPRLADAYNFLGIQYTQLQEFDYAYEAFDSAIELEPKHNYAYLNRGIAEYYDSRFELSKEDLVAHLDREPSDPYRVIWLYLTSVDINAEKAKKALSHNVSELDKSEWGYQIVQLFLEKLSVDEYQKRMTKQLNEDEELTERLCEAYFYLGKYMQMKNRPVEAMNYFKLALSTNVYEFVEHRYASVELDRVRRSLINR